MAKGDLAKKSIVDKLKSCFGEDWIGEYSKKYYVYAKENGEKIQIAISLTCPQTQVSIATGMSNSNELNFEDESEPVLAASGFEPAQLTDEEKDRVNDLLKKFNL